MRFPLTREKLLKSEKLVEMLPAKEKEGEAYDALLATALSGCRAVPWVLQREIAVNVPVLLPWYEARDREMGLPRNSAVIWLRDARNLSTEPEPPKVDPAASYRNLRTAKLPPGAALAVTDRGELMRITKDADGRETRTRVSEFDSRITATRRIVRPGPPLPLLLEGRDISGLDATDTLRQYVGFLRRLVEAAESAKA